MSLPTDDPALIKRLQKRRLEHEIAKRRARRARRSRKSGKLLETSGTFLHGLCQSGLLAEGACSYEGGDATVSVPSAFSFLEAPDVALATLKALHGVDQERYVRTLRIDHSNCRRLDLDASVIMDVLLLGHRHRWRRQRSKVSLCGAHSRVPQVEEMLRAAGLFHNLRIAHEEREYEHVETFDLFLGRAGKPKPRQSTDSERAAEALQKYVRRCLNRNDLDLTLPGRRHMLGLLGEVLDNASLHSGAPAWYVIGYLSQIETNGSPRGDCSLVIVSPGRTIFETISSPSVAGDLQRRLAELSGAHEKRGFFSKRWDKEALWTLYALQEGVTRFRVGGSSESARRRGIGTAEMIEFFEKLCARRPVDGGRMCVLSGSAYVLFDGRYSLANQEFGGETRRVIAFNGQNDLREPPDERNVFKLKGRFPGTIISMRFPIDSRLLEGV